LGASSKTQFNKHEFKKKKTNRVQPNPGNPVPTTGYPVPKPGNKSTH